MVPAKATPLPRTFAPLHKDQEPFRKGKVGTVEALSDLHKVNPKAAWILGSIALATVLIIGVFAARDFGCFDKNAEQPKTSRQKTATPTLASNVYVTKDGAMACPALEKIKKLTHLLLIDDKLAAARYNMQNPDIIELKAGLVVEITDSTWTGWVKIRPRGQTIELWTKRVCIQEMGNSPCESSE